MVEYPVAFAEVQSGGDADCNEHPELCTPANFCGGAVKNLVEVSMLGTTHHSLTLSTPRTHTRSIYLLAAEVTYTVGAICYFVFLLRCPPRWFYNVVVPVSAVLMALLMVAFWFLESMPHTMAFIFISIAVVAPNYLERYNFYFWMSGIFLLDYTLQYMSQKLNLFLFSFISVIDSKHFGFFYGIYGIGQNILHLTVSLVLALFGNQIASGSWAFNSLLAICIGMMGVVFIYSSWFGCAYATHFNKSPSSESECDREREALIQERTHDGVQNHHLADTAENRV